MTRKPAEFHTVYWQQFIHEEFQLKKKTIPVWICVSTVQQQVGNEYIHQAFTTEAFKTCIQYTALRSSKALNAFFMNARLIQGTISKWVYLKKISVLLYVSQRSINRKVEFIF